VLVLGTLGRRVNIGCFYRATTGRLNLESKLDLQTLVLVYRLAFGFSITGAAVANTTKLRLMCYGRLRLARFKSYWYVYQCLTN
jgi:hypothetical protein